MLLQLAKQRRRADLTRTHAIRQPDLSAPAQSQRADAVHFAASRWCSASSGWRGYCSRCLRRGSARSASPSVHANDAAARQRRRPAQRDRRQHPDGRDGHADRHADRNSRRHLSRRIRQPRLARAGHALHQRHPAVRAVDRHRTLHLFRSTSSNVRHFSGWGGTLALALIVIPVVVRTTDNMLQPRARTACAKRLSRSARRNGR